MRWSSVTERLLAALLPVLAVVAEGAWITIVYAAVQTTIDGQVPLLGTLEFALLATAAMLVVRRRLLAPDDEPLRFFGLLVGIGAAGWLWDAAPRQLLLQGDLVSAIGLHPGGWLTILASMRGVSLAGGVDDRAATRLVLLGVPALAIPWSFGQIAAGPLQPVFAEEAFVASLTFVSAGFMAAGLARLQVIGAETGVDWRANRSWLGLVAGVLLLVLGIGVPAASLLGLPVETVARGVVGPLAALLGYVLLAFAYVAGLVYAGLYTVLREIGVTFELPLLRPGQNPFVVDEYTYRDLQGGLLAVGIFWLLIGLLAIVVARTWLRRRFRPRVRRVEEERVIQLPPATIRVELPRIRWPRRRRVTAPGDAVGAYLAALELLDREPTLARRRSETPRAHAHRLLGAGVPWPELTLLQADYALARYGGRALTPAEERRAVGRWRRLRDRLRAGIRDLLPTAPAG